MKLALCRVLLMDPKIMFLNEPALGLDLKTTNFIIERLKSLDKTVFLTSHNLNVLEKACNKFAFIKDGSIILEGSKKELNDFFQKEVQIAIIAPNYC